jgi:hypothetical protein
VNPKCQIQWIDCDGKPTPDQNEAIGLASITSHGQTQRFPICAAHLASMGQVHSGRCRHVSAHGSRWVFEPFEQGAEGDTTP